MWHVRDARMYEMSDMMNVLHQYSTSYTACNKQRIVQAFPRRDSKRKKRLQENGAIQCVLLCLMCMIALFSWSLFVGLESLLGNLGI